MSKGTERSYIWARNAKGELSLPKVDKSHAVAGDSSGVLASMPLESAY